MVRAIPIKSIFRKLQQYREFLQGITRQEKTIKPLQIVNIELEITLRCNSKCPQCSRHCNVFSYGPSDMSMDQIHRFIDQVLSSYANLGHINVMGGEPTMHPRLEEIISLLYESLVLRQKVQVLEIATNGILDVPEPILKLPVAIKKSPPCSKQHRCQFIAPRDTGQKMKKCNVPYIYGMALNCYGYFPCGAGGAIIRLFNMKDFIKYELPSTPGDFGDLGKLCSLCQASAENPKMFGIDDCTPSKSFLDAIDKYYKERPKFRFF